MWLRQLFLSASVLAGSLLLCSCSPSGASIPEGSEDLQQCVDRTIGVEDLAKRGEPGCNLMNSVVVFPDGYEFGVAEIGENVSKGYIPQDSNLRYEYGVINFGTAGVVAIRQLDDQDKEVWASTPLAHELYKSL